MYLGLKRLTIVGEDRDDVQKIPDLNEGGVVNRG